MTLPDRANDPNRAPMTSHYEFAKQVNSGGGTRDLNGAPLDKKRGYMVSVPGFEEVHTPNSVSPAGRRKGVSDIDIAQHTGRLRAAVKTGDLPEGVYQGGWSDNGSTYLDASQYHSRKKDALRAGKKYNQLAIYDIKNQQDIRLDGK